LPQPVTLLIFKPRLISTIGLSFLMTDGWSISNLQFYLSSTSFASLIIFYQTIFFLPQAANEIGIMQINSQKLDKTPMSKHIYPTNTFLQRQIDSINRLQILMR